MPTLFMWLMKATATTPFPTACTRWPQRRPQQDYRSGYSIPAQGQWNLAYVLQSGLQLGVPYTVDGYPTGNNSATGLPWSPGTDGLRNITGIVNGDGTATIYAVTSTVGGNGDQGADPNKVVVITDDVSATNLPPSESFTTFRAAGLLEVLRGVSFAQGTGGGR